MNHETLNLSYFTKPRTDAERISEARLSLQTAIRQYAPGDDLTIVGHMVDAFLFLGGDPAMVSHVPTR